MAECLLRSRTVLVAVSWLISINIMYRFLGAAAVKFSVLLIRKEEEEPQFFSTVRPEEIPEIPSNKFLFRGSPPKKVEADRFVLSGIFVLRLMYKKLFSKLSSSSSNSSFSVAAPSAWNRLPSHIRTSPTYTLFLTRLKTHLFAESLLWHRYAVVFSLYFWRPRALDVGRHSKFMLIDW